MSTPTAQIMFRQAHQGDIRREFRLVLLGIGLLYGGGEAVVRGAVAFARSVGMSPLVIGIWPLATQARILRREVPFMLFASGLLFPLAADSRIGASRVSGCSSCWWCFSPI